MLPTGANAVKGHHVSSADNYDVPNAMYQFLFNQLNKHFPPIHF